MANEVVDHGRRRFLTATTSVVGGIGIVAAAVPFIKSWEPSARAKAAGAPVTQSLAKIEAGQMLTVSWRSLPVFVLNRTKAQLATLPMVDSRLVDPKSDGGSADQQPKYAQNEARSIKPEWLVVIGICTHLGCVPDFVPEIKPEPFDPDWKGGFYCPCHKSRYDLAGRVYAGVPAPKNLPVPPYHFIDDSTIQIGVDPKEAG
ncbi:MULTISPECIES: ubiquinol-cytochrome c reductase iron-sulfur subunit [Rhodanobacter]|uniref:Ubiquinol-cytochrome c reductase iron-sulfur subunit n=1 Tax=Rhodanobacter thiooxydans TaxID=416169 RepID=A0A154QEA2_9GAMM|nr:MULTISPECIES: ubiquinol-cytochrome c reductase iron-sulfur subunit [Rhodanobacter]TAN16718.1 MAG: ubiquinol-cytochrome c reductase iron-sulfur subunit [Rhodanobacter sp.]EIL96872.1 ubiquinol cytochrome C oxidoreductase, iron-sulfur subunit [Rhodanobacter thiooxydans LCS2]KZC22087.1 ubiquinol-cytochrome c reductase iron-sulfur subunit [Rhodanobacter thiooxydans]MCW0201495.1 ubiquinol-cytochrome c reductase iron-sulfur subunit [Rhodanobacter thiooxydans]UJJ54217.1 ubiquinol-cytochrome c reduc